MAIPNVRIMEETITSLARVTGTIRKRYTTQATRNRRGTVTESERIGSTPQCLKRAYAMNAPARPKVAWEILMTFMTPQVREKPTPSSAYTAPIMMPLMSD